MSFFGDGACNIGAFHEALNLAAVWRLPVLFVCENNLYGEFSRINHTTTTEDLYQRVAAYGIASEAVDGNDVLAVLQTTRRAADRARAGEGPTFIECKTYRHRGHSRTDPAKYRPEEELQAWLKRDPLILFRQILVERGVLDNKQAEELAESIRKEMKAAAETAASYPLPEPRDFLVETYVL